jgi:propionate catabolism operon transcriptional regulator
LIAAHRYGRSVDIALLEELSGCSIDLLLYEDSSELYHGISDSDADVVIGTSHALEIAQELQKKGVLLYYSEETIRSAVRRARNLAQDLQMNALQAKINQAIINYSPLGIAVTDEYGQIVLFNRTIRKQTGMESARVNGRQLSDLIPSLDPKTFLGSENNQADQRKLINGTMLRCTQTRIDDRGKTIAVLTTLYPDNTRRSKSAGSEKGDFRATYSWKDAIGNSPAAESAIRQAKLLADQIHPIVITGEPGVGKNFFAQCIHNGSLRAGEPYISINTAAIPDQEASRILFGSEDVAGSRAGLLELAQNGTVVLQELGSATDTVQSCILKVLTERQFRHLGGTVSIPFRAKLITTINSEKAREHIRENLWQRLSVFWLEVPPLRERKEDILPLFLHLSRDSGINPRWFGTEAEELLQFYSWPGNLAELSSVCKRFAFLVRQVEKPSPSARQNLLIQAIGEDRLFREFLKKYSFLNNPGSASPADLTAALDHIKHLLKYNNDKLAVKLTLSRTTLWRLKKASQDNSDSSGN